MYGIRNDALLVKLYDYNVTSNKSYDYNATNNINLSEIINLVIIIPLRNRDRQLALFTNYIQDYIYKYDKKIHLSGIIVVEQLMSDNQSFGKSALFNIGFNYMLSNKSSFKNKNIQYIALHDVDWYPYKPTSYYPIKPYIHFQHIAPVGYPGQYGYRGYVGGISIISVYGFKHCINGFSNHYFGWGAEDDDLFHRLNKGHYLPECNLTKRNFINISSPQLPVYADYKHLNMNTSRTLHKYHYRKETNNNKYGTIDYKWNYKRYRMQICDRNGSLMSNDGVNNMIKYKMVDVEIFGKLTIVRVKLFRNDSWHKLINKYIDNNGKCITK